MCLFRSGFPSKCLSTKGKKLMQVGRYFRTVGLLLVGSVIGLAGGCGSGAPQPGIPGAGKVVKEDMRNLHKELKEGRKAAAKEARAERLLQKQGHER
jgi:hypothetical protein